MSISNSLEVSGFVNRPETKTSKNGKSYVQFTLNVLNGNNKDGTKSKVFVKCMDFSEEALLPEDGCRLYVKGRPLFGAYTAKDGTVRPDVSVFVEESTIINVGSGDRQYSAPKTYQQKSDDEKDPWE